MTDLADQPPVIAYQNAGTTVRVASVDQAKWSLVCGVTPSVVGLLIVGLYWITWWEWLPQAGMFWLLIGGFMALSGLINSIMGLIQVRGVCINKRYAYRRHLAGLIGSLLSGPTAVFCFMAGATLMMEPHFVLEVRNDAGRRVDSVTIHFDGGDEALGPIDPGKTASRRVRTNHRGELFITTRINDQTRRRMDRIYADENSLMPGPYQMQIEEKELPAP